MELGSILTPSPSLSRQDHFFSFTGFISLRLVFAVIIQKYEKVTQCSTQMLGLTRIQ